MLRAKNFIGERHDLVASLVEIGDDDRDARLRASRGAGIARSRVRTPLPRAAWPRSCCGGWRARVRAPRPRRPPCPRRAVRSTSRRCCGVSAMNPSRMTRPVSPSQDRRAICVRTSGSCASSIASSAVRRAWYRPAHCAKIAGSSLRAFAAMIVEPFVRIAIGVQCRPRIGRVPRGAARVQPIAVVARDDSMPERARSRLVEKHRRRWLRTRRERRAPHSSQPERPGKRGRSAPRPRALRPLRRVETCRNIAREAIVGRNDGCAGSERFDEIRHRECARRATDGAATR